MPLKNKQKLPKHLYLMKKNQREISKLKKLQAKRTRKRIKSQSFDGEYYKGLVDAARQKFVPKFFLK